MSATTRALATADVPAALEVFRAVGWGDRRVLLDFYRERTDTALLVAEAAGRIVGCAGATTLGPTDAPRTGWVHNVVVDPEQRGGGIGTALTERAIGWLRSRGVPTILLLATDAGRPVYERLGFKADVRYAALECPSLESARASTARVRRARRRDLPAMLALDREATGEDRSAFLLDVAGSAWVAEDDSGVVLGFHAPCAWGQGPSIARTREVGCRLIDLARAVHGPDAVRFGVPETNRDALAYFAEHGVTPQRHVTRMWLGGALPALRAELVYGVFNFACG